MKSVTGKDSAGPDGGGSRLGGPASEPSLSSSSRLIVCSEVMQSLLSRLPPIARSSVPVLITGESGTGKELIARELHRLSLREGQPLVAINCGAFPEQLLESEMFGYKRGAFTGAQRDRQGVAMEAHGGTLFMDEVGETSLPFQVKLLRFLQEGEVRPLGDDKSVRVDVRIVAATNRELPQLIGQGRFREDLYYRLNVIPLHLPPLRERREDIIPLATHFLRRCGAELGRSLRFSEDALDALQAYAWPGNVRELENKVRALSVVTAEEVIRRHDLGLPHQESLPIQEEGLLSFQKAKVLAVTRFERNYLEALLTRCQGSPTRAAQEAGLDRKNLWRLLKKHQLDVGKFRG